MFVAHRSYFSLDCANDWNFIRTRLIEFIKDSITLMKNKLAGRPWFALES